MGFGLKELAQKFSFTMALLHTLHFLIFEIFIISRLINVIQQDFSCFGTGFFLFNIENLPRKAISHVKICI